MCDMAHADVRYESFVFIHLLNSFIRAPIYSALLLIMPWALTVQLYHSQIKIKNRVY